MAGEQSREEALRRKIEEQVRKYDNKKVVDTERSHYVLYAKALRAILKRACKRCGVLGFVEARAKATTSFAEKVSRKGMDLEDPIKEFTDLCGARVVVQTQGEVDRICRFVRDHFRIDEENSPDIRSRLQVGEFGYLSEHLVVQMPWVTLEGVRPVLDNGVSPEEQLLRDILQPLHERGWTEVARIIGARKAEVQVRTLLQHAWAAISHDRAYKSEFDPPQRLQRLLHRMAALLEEADGQLHGVVSDVDTYNLHYAAYLNPEQIEKELGRWKVILSQTSGESGLGPAMRCARLAAAREDWVDVAAVLGPYGGSAPPKMEPPRARMQADVLRELGLAKSKLHRGGRRELERAVALNKMDFDALCYLGDTYCERSDTHIHPGRGLADCDRACECYAKAFEIAPAEPHVLGCYLECKLCRERNVRALPMLRPGLQAAVRTCRDRAETGVYVPYAYYDMGRFQLLLDEPYRSLSAFAMAVHHSRGPERIEIALSTVDKLWDATRGALEELPPDAGKVERKHLCEWVRWCGWVHRFLLLARAVKLRQVADQRAAQFTRARDASQAADDEKAEAEKALEEVAAGKREEAEARLAEASQAADRAAQEAEDLKAAAAGAAETADEARDELCERLGTHAEVCKNRPVVIVAGGTDQSVEEQMGQYGNTVRKAFAGFEGTIVSGGTTAGISGIIGGLSTGDAVQKVSYLPDRNRLPDDAELDPGYTDIREPVPLEEAPCPAEDDETVPFTPLEPIQCWIDLVCAGIPPGRVTVLGINGGEIAAFEYRLALALGATVGIIQSSGRAAADMLEEVDHWRPGSLIWLPMDAMCLRAFVQPPREPREPLGERDMLERAARTVHEKYREDKIASADPALKPWEPLGEGFKDSNRQQVLYAERILATERYELRPVEAEGEAVNEFRDAELRRMAEKEHGRWVVERLRAAWQPGAVKDKERKISPYLCAWSKLSSEVKGYDLKAVGDWPEVMAAVGLKIVRANR